MSLQIKLSKTRTHCLGFTLVEVLVSFAVLTLVISGLVYGYVLANRMAEWSSMSLAAQSSASQGAERARAANWRPRDYPPATGPGTMDELPPSVNGGPVFTNVDYFDIPTKGDPSSGDFDSWVTNIVWVTTVSANPPLRLIRSDAIWRFPPTGQAYTNTITLLRAPDQ
ncbi:MAG TPA: type II secretion system protein [Verrucomicrobiae bacterium]|nr:type II secretion system protein [Verrucomicrobiae bacterium]